MKSISALSVVVIASGGALGALTRWGISLFIASHVSSAFPWATFSINIVGCIVIGLASALVSKVQTLYLGQFLIIGFLGAFTTFSTYSMEGINLIMTDKWATGLAYIVSSNILGLMAVIIGFKIGKFI